MHFITLQDLPSRKILHLVQQAWRIKQSIKTHQFEEKFNAQLVRGKTLAMLFSKRSTRTRVSAESGWAHFGGHPMFLSKDDVQIGGGEPLHDTAVVLSSMAHAILARVGDHKEIEILAQNSSVPVINALSDKFHPLQILADVLTLYEVYAPNAINDHELPSLNKLKVAWVGDSNNIVNSMLVSLPRIGISLSIASPTGYESPPDVVDFAQSNSNQNGFGKLCITHSIGEAVKDADVLVTDTWVSMGQEAEKAKRIHDFKGFQVTETMAKIHGAKHNWKFMHCLPRKPEEVDDEVFYNSNRSLVFDEAENRKYTIMAVFLSLFQK